MNDPNDYADDIKAAIAHFWDTRLKQRSFSKSKEEKDNRAAVVGGKQMDGFIQLFKQVATDFGVPSSCIFTKGNHLPGFFRPTKDWDFLVLSPQHKLVALLEFKSQVGSFGNNFNNRTEEAIGSAVDVWTAFREQVYPNQRPPWIGYLILVEKSVKSLTPVKVRSPYFSYLKEFEGTSYLERYAILCRKLMLERHYSATSLIWTDNKKNYGDMAQELSINGFIASFVGCLQSWKTEFDE